MIKGKVIGNVVSTKKNDKLLGCKFLLIALSTGSELIAADNIGAGIGDEVIVVQGHNVIYAMRDNEPLPIDAVIIGIID